MFAPPIARTKTKSGDPQHATVAPQRPSQSAVDQALLLQRTIGNQAMLRLLAQRPSVTRNEPDAHEREDNAARITGRKIAPSWDFCKIPVFSPEEMDGVQSLSPFPAPPLPGPIQAKLKIGAVNDPLEHEADRVADQVMRMPDPEVSISAVLPQISRKCAECEEEEKKLQKKPTATAEAAGGEAPAHEVLRSPGQPLDAQTRAFFEPRFGQDLGGVRIHTDGNAAAAAHDLDALAFTIGHDMVFGASRFEPQTHEGQRLIAHELTHVVQQSGIEGTGIGHSSDLSSGSLPTLIQRQPEEKKDPPKKQPAKKTLRSEGVDLQDPVAVKTVTIIDDVLARNQKLAPYIGDQLAAGVKIAAKGKFIQDITDPIFEDAYRKAYDLHPTDSVPKHDLGFFDPKTSEIHVRPGAKFGTALHELVHRLASPVLYSVYLPLANKVSTDLLEVLKEGVTAFFTDQILKDEGLPNYNDAYIKEKKKAETLINALGSKSEGFDLIAKFNFKSTGIVEIGEKLGFTKQQYAAAKGDAIRQVLKKMEQAM